ncbi:hypothetical protein [Pseudomonas jessenii]|uniref:hypothetical protein n=1 Tax=Pseudomonas jessenii TaxID=77298 RepID=UPI0032E39F0C
MKMTGQVECKRVVKWSAISHFHQTVGTDDFHDPIQVLGENIQGHLRIHPGQFSRQEVRRTHPLFERPEGMR